MTELIVVGLDGAGYQLLDRWLGDDDVLPTLTRLTEEGRWGELRSSYPPVTSPAWKCYSTGVNPGKHGVFWWEQFDRQEKKIRVPDSRSFDSPDVWDYLGEEGYTSGVVNMPTTYPPSRIEGWMVSGIGCTDDYTYPEGLQKELEDEVGYRGRLQAPTSTIKDDPGFLSEILDFVDERFDAAEYIKEEYDPDFLHLTIFDTNAVQHYHWGGEVNKKLWQHVDQRISGLVDDENVVVMSDHGSNEIETVFNINAWLEQERYLRTTRSKSDLLYRFGVTRENAARIMDKLHVRNLMERLVPDSVKYAVPDSDGNVGRSGKMNKIDWCETKVFASGQGPIYVLAEGDERDRLVTEIKEKLAGLKTPEGEPVARNVFRAEEVYEGPYVRAGPDLVIDQADNVHIPDSVGSSEVFVDPGEWKWESENHRDGLFIASGPDVADGGELDRRPEIYDLAPTILHWYGVRVPSHLDGRVLMEIFREGSEPMESEVEFRESEGVSGRDTEVGVDDEGMRDHLRDLGYLS